MISQKIWFCSFALTSHTPLGPKSGEYARKQIVKASSQLVHAPLLPFMPPQQTSVECYNRVLQKNGGENVCSTGTNVREPINIVLRKYFSSFAMTWCKRWRAGKMCLVALLICSLCLPHFECAYMGEVKNYCKYGA